MRPSDGGESKFASVVKILDSARGPNGLGVLILFVTRPFGRVRLEIVTCFTVWQQLELRRACQSIRVCCSNITKTTNQGLSLTRHPLLLGSMRRDWRRLYEG